jgi:ketosteroid isomerase-like protein
VSTGSTSDRAVDAVDVRVLAATYVDRVNARDADHLLALFAPDAALRHPAGTFTGHDQIRGFYVDLVFAGQAAVTLGRVFVEDDAAAFELRATSELDPDGAIVETVDVMDVDPTGHITALGVYYR